MTSRNLVERRKHLTLARYLADLAWRRGLDCVAIARRDLLAYLGFKRKLPINGDPYLSLLADIRPWFARETCSVQGPTGREVFQTLFLSRKVFPPGFDELQRMPDTERIRRLNREGLRCELISVPSEAEVARRLALASRGFPLG